MWPASNRKSATTSPGGAIFLIDVGHQPQSGNFYNAAIAVKYPESSELLQFGKKHQCVQSVASDRAIYRKTFNFGEQHVAVADFKVDLTGTVNSMASPLAVDLNFPL
jgi:hypothetical protein